MRSFVSFGLALAFAFAPFAHAAPAKTDKKSKKSKDANSNPDAPKFDVPIPVGHKAEGVTLPYFDDTGKLQMNYKIESAMRADNEHLQMTRVEVETYDDDGKSEMRIDIPSAVLDLNTKIVTSDSPVTIHRADFEVTGERMRFNTDTRNGVMIGRVRMLIYNHAEMSEPKKAE